MVVEAEKNPAEEEGDKNAAEEEEDKNTAGEEDNKSAEKEGMDLAGQVAKETNSEAQSQNDFISQMHEMHTEDPASKGGSAVISKVVKTQVALDEGTDLPSEAVLEEEDASRNTQMKKIESRRKRSKLQEIKKKEKLSGAERTEVPANQKRCGVRHLGMVGDAQYSVPSPILHCS